MKAVGAILTQEEVALFGSEILLKQNKTDGFMCVSCSWAKPASPHPFEFCENGAKATAWELPPRRPLRNSSTSTRSPSCGLGRTWIWKTMGGSPILCATTRRAINMFPLCGRTRFKR